MWGSQLLRARVTCGMFVIVARLRFNTAFKEAMLQGVLVADCACGVVLFVAFRTRAHTT